VFLVALVMTSRVAAQGGMPLSGRLLMSLNGAPLGGATIQIEELRRQTTSAADGTFTFENVPFGTYHLSVLAQGFSTRRTEVTVAAGTGPIELQVDFDLHFEEVVSVGDARSQFETFQPTSVLAGQELSPTT
jgi:iron complex outermembrane receptor protein